MSTSAPKGTAKRSFYFTFMAFADMFLFTFFAFMITKSLLGTLGWEMDEVRLTVSR
ncbi:hypothetical protein D8827_00995 [Streptococcus intermedius]|uniref:Uncharacterized protein n=1 Tax=Streptococcus intermedius TaxID=1338 RepID=A0AAE8G3Z1_STRIT|nr:hypothetical protein [Streptococcus intermedius]EHG13467.1 hypothetical protein HMPREF9177_00479 [Streptococcus intermedius F0413]QKH78195.1 hypothetical protein FOC71_06705 [Streptococcus intermedius]RSJ24346.1 hypothetical protein D8827_00995 [Streptococcus intermedius]